jgi:hypothetical protein
VHREIPEADWKVFRQLRPLALERFCQRVLDELGQIGGGSGQSSHERFLAVYERIHERNEELAAAFDNPRRSTAIIQLAHIRAGGLLTDEEFSRFSAETRERVELLTQIWSR